MGNRAGSPAPVGPPSSLPLWLRFPLAPGRWSFKASKRGSPRVGTVRIPAHAGGPMSLPVWDPRVPPPLLHCFGGSGSFGGLKSSMLYLRVLGPKCLLSFGLCGHQFCRTSSCPALSSTPASSAPPNQAHWGRNPKPGEHPNGPPHLPVTLWGSWLSNSAAWIAGSSLGPLMGLIGYSLPNTIPPHLTLTAGLG